MALIQSFVYLIPFVVCVLSASDYNETAEAARPLIDRFRLIQNNIDEDRLDDEINDFTSYGCEKMVVIRNKAQDRIKLSCKSRHDTPKQTVIEVDHNYAFSFRPRKSGNSKYWCTVEYKQQFARLDVYNEELSYMCPRDIDEIYQYIVHHDGVYVVKKGEHGQKIKSLMKGHNKFILWEEFVESETNGYLIAGLVDGGMCYDIPDQFNDKTAAVTVCYNHCIHLYEHYGCRGKMQTLQASDNCVDIGVDEQLGGKLSAIQGC